MKKSEIAIGKIAYSEFPDKGIIEREDGTVIIKHAIPGQTVEYLITKKRNKKAEGRVLKVVETSELEDAQEICIHSLCGGCSYRSLSYDNQIKLKDKQMRNLLDEACDSEYIWEGIVKSPSSLYYRNKMEYSFGDEQKGGDLSLGMHKRASHYDVITTEQCKIVHEDFNVIQRESLKFFSERGISYFHKHDRKGLLRHLIVRRSSAFDELLINIVTTSKESDFIEDREVVLELPKNITKLLEEYKEHILSLEGLTLKAKVAGIVHTVNNSYADAVINQESYLIYGRDYIYESLLGLKFKISTFSFFQTNSKGAELLYKAVIDYVGDTKGKCIYDLYSGTGTIAQLLSKAAERVYAIEIIEEAVEAAKENAGLNDIYNCEFLAGDVLKMVDELAGKVDVIVLDPPRDGIHPKALPKIIDFAAKEIIYVSCKPTSLARDLRNLQDAGYVMKKAVGVDMFPNTANVELVALFEKNR